ncbi:MAG: hypothetical protein KY464_01935 [Gemmatimonadetes bacterium]|nr:hypothetical protein [Gemmatimonadota bacterium]
MTGSEVRVLDDPDRVAERVQQGGYPDPFADVLHIGVDHRPTPDQIAYRPFDVRYTPVSDHRPRGRAGCFTRLQPQLVPGNVEPDVERLVEVRLDPERTRVPGRAVGTSGTRWMTV